MKGDPGDDQIRAIARGLAVLRVMNTAQRWTLHDLHLQLGLAKSTLFRVLATLQHEGYVRVDVARGQYTLTGKVRELSAGYTEQSELVARGAPIALRVTREIKWPLAIGVRDGDALVVGYSTMPYSPLAVHATTVGHRLGLVNTAMGQAYLAWCSPAERDSLIALFVETMGPESEAALPDIDAVLARVAADGYAVRRAIRASDSATLAVPILSNGQSVAALGMTIFGGLMSARLINQHLPVLQRTAREIADAFGAGQPAPGSGTGTR